MFSTDREIFILGLKVFILSSMCGIFSFNIQAQFWVAVHPISVEEEIANLSDAQFKILVIKTLTELVELVQKPNEKMKPMLRETKESVQGTNSDVKETGT